MLEKSSIADEMHAAIVHLAGDRSWFDGRERWIAKAATRAGISYRAAKALFYREASNPSGETIDRVRRAVSRMATEQQQQEATARAEYAELVERIARIEARLSQEDADFHRPSIDGFRASLFGSGAENRPVDRGSELKE